MLQKCGGGGGGSSSGGRGGGIMTCDWLSQYFSHLIKRLGIENADVPRAHIGHRAHFLDM
jgi:hypothetical protein